MDEDACLPVPPKVRDVSMVEVIYCIERRSDHLWHEHIALFDAGTKKLRFDICSLTI